MHSVVTASLWILCGLCVAAVIYPYVLYPIILRFLPERRISASHIQSDRGREFALLFCAYNEAKALPDKISNLRKLHATYPDLEFLAFDDRSSDGTAELLENCGLPIKVVRGTGRNGKAHGMKLLATLTDREFLIFTDANVELEPESNQPPSISVLRRMSGSHLWTSGVHRPGRYAYSLTSAGGIGGSKSESRPLNLFPAMSWGLTDRSSRSAGRFILNSLTQSWTTSRFPWPSYSKAGALF